MLRWASPSSHLAKLRRLNLKLILGTWPQIASDITLTDRKRRMNGLRLDGLMLAPPQVLGGVRLVPLIRTENRSDLRLSRRAYGEDFTFVEIDSKTVYTSYVPHGLVANSAGKNEVDANWILRFQSSCLNQAGSVVFGGPNRKSRGGPLCHTLLTVGSCRGQYPIEVLGILPCQLATAVQTIKFQRWRCQAFP